MESLDKAKKIFKQEWKVPYLHIDPADIGRHYEKLIRINSQSGKGGIAFILEHEFGIFPPKAMQPEIGDAVQKLADKKGDEIDSKELLKAFKKNFVNVKGRYSLLKFSRVNSKDPDKVSVKITVKSASKTYELKGKGNGPISAVVHALKEKTGCVIDFILDDFCEQSLGHDADATAMAFIGIRRLSDNRLIYGAGEHSNIDQAAMLALFAALNRAVK
jgi:2-isopropylmalate synthase